MDEAVVGGKNQIREHDGVFRPQQTSSQLNEQVEGNAEAVANALAALLYVARKKNPLRYEWRWRRGSPIAGYVYRVSRRGYVYTSYTGVCGFQPDVLYHLAYLARWFPGKGYHIVLAGSPRPVLRGLRRAVKKISGDRYVRVFRDTVIRYYPGDGAARVVVDDEEVDSAAGYGYLLVGPAYMFLYIRRCGYGWVVMYGRRGEDGGR